MNKSDKTIIGRIESAAFPELSIDDVPVKIDTGAYSSAIHCSRIELLPDGKLEVVFLDKDDAAFLGTALVFERYDKRKIKSSSGHSETRFSIDTLLRLGANDYPVRLTLADRSTMRVPVLIGRRFLKKNRFVVDPQRKNTWANKGKNK
jgi:hypothetical protein